MTLASGARVGARGRRLVTAVPGRPGHQPAGTMTGARGASLEVPHRKVCHEAWPRLSLGMKYSQWQRAVVGRREASAQRSARAAPERCGGWIRVCRRSASLFFFRTSWLKAQIVRIPAATAGVLWRRSGRRAKKFSSRDDDSGADRIARTIPYVVIAGLDPAIHGACQHGPPGQARW
jgi:hypothetical protein